MTANSETPTVRERLEARMARARERRRRAARTWLGLAGLTYDAGRSILEAVEELRDKAQARGEQVEAEMNTRAARLQDTVRSKIDKRRLRIRARIDRLARNVDARGQQVERAIKEKLSTITPRTAEDAAPRDKHIEIEVEAAPEPFLAGYDDLNVKQVVERITSLDPQALTAVRAYEAAHKNRVTILREIDRRMSAP